MVDADSNHESPSFSLTKTFQADLTLDSSSVGQPRRAGNILEDGRLLVRDFAVPPRCSSFLGRLALAWLAITAVNMVLRGAALAKAPPLATTVLEVEILADPSLDAAAVAILPAGIEVELTGAAEPGYLGIYNDGEPAWVPAQYLTLGERPGIDTAVAIQDTPLLDAPMHDASVLATVPEGEAVILTGARLDGYDAASHDGVGGWIRERDLAR